MAQIATLPPAFSSSVALPAVPDYDAATLTHNLLPVYTIGQDAALPEYQPPVARRSTDALTASRRNVEHVIETRNSKDRAWLTMKVNSRAPSVKSLPVFLEEDIITGEIALNLEKQDTIQAVIIKVQGLVVAAHSDIKPFLELREVLWDTSRGDPRSPSPDQGKHNGKLTGQYSWPFTFTLPKMTNVPSKQLKELGFLEQVPLPPSFAEKGSFSLLSYELSAVIKRSGLRIDTILTTGFGYTPKTRPDPPSVLRQMAYREGMPLLGPDVDPEGWHVLPPIEMQGMMFSAVKVNIKATLALSKPLAYTRGSLIPCTITLESSDTAALDLLAKPNVPTLNLHRKLNSKLINDPFAARAGRRNSHNINFLVDATNNSHLPLCSASWWNTRHSDESTGGEPNKRTLSGEIRIPPGARPSFAFRDFFVQYELKLLPLKTIGFIPEDSNVLSTTDVQITSDFARGPRPRAYALVQGNDSAVSPGNQVDLLSLHWGTGQGEHGFM